MSERRKPVFRRLDAVVIGGILIVSCAAPVAEVPKPSPAEAESAAPRRPWESVLDGLYAERDRISAGLDQTHERLVARARRIGDDEALARLRPAPPEPLAEGYGILPEITEPSGPFVARSRSTRYSLEELVGWVREDLVDVETLVEDVVAGIEEPLEPAVTEFERLRDRMQNVDEHLAYHANWQASVIEYAAFFAEQNEIGDLIREIDRRRDAGASAAELEALELELLDRAAPFDAAPGPRIEDADDGSRRLVVPVVTDITDGLFLDAFREGVEQVYNAGPAMRDAGIRLVIELERWTPDRLYPDGAPAYGSEIDVTEHTARFPRGTLVLTTGASSTHAIPGRVVALGPTKISRRTLAHEFAHLFGFRDGYVRGFEGDSDDRFGVTLVEWNGLTDDLMGRPGHGEVGRAMVERLVAAYGD